MIKTAKTKIKTTQKVKNASQVKGKTGVVTTPKIELKNKKPAIINKNSDRLNKQANALVEGLLLPRKVVLQIADEVAKVVTKSMKRQEVQKTKKKIDNPIFLDTSAIIDGRVFDLIKLGIFTGTYVAIDGVLTELKNIADSKDDTKRERGRKGLKMLEELKKSKDVQYTNLKENKAESVDDAIISEAVSYKGKVITCDYNLSKKARLSNIMAIDMYELANILKTVAIPGEVFWIKVIQKGKTEGQGVGYLPDGTMIVVEKGVDFMGKTVRVLVSRIIQTDAGKIFFAKALENQAPTN